MPLTNTQYDAILRHYDEIRERNRRDLADRTQEIHARIPEYASLTDRVAVLSLEAASARIADPHADLTAYHAEMDRIAEERTHLLLRAGYPADYLSMHYDCPACRDTGYIDGAPCACFARAACDLLYGGPRLSEVLAAENFDHFSFDWYSDTITDEASGKTPLSLARGAVSTAKALLRADGKEPFNLYIYGTTGVGKTFLTHCIAKEAMDMGKSVLYFSAGEMFDTLADAAFGRSGGAVRKLITESDLLLIDDLGTEMLNNFTASEFFRIINDRIRMGLSTVISTKLTLKELGERYSERIVSRITSSYRMLKMAGEDIRIKKVLQRP